MVTRRGRASRSRSRASSSSATCTGASTRNWAWVKSRPTFTPTSPGSRRARASSSVVSSPAKMVAVAPVAWRRKCYALALRGVDHGGLQHPVAALQVDTRAGPAGRPGRRRRRPRRRRPRPAGCAGRRRPACPPAGCPERPPRCPPDSRRTSASSSRWSSSSSSSEDPGPIQTSAPWLPISRVFSGGEGDRPQAVQRPAGDERRRRPRKFGQRGEGRGRARKGAGVPGMVHERGHGAVEVHRDQQVLRRGDARGRPPAVPGRA